MKYFVLIMGVAIGIFGFQGANKNSSHDSKLPNRASAVDSDWMHDLQSALAHAKQSNKPVLIDFNASWCPPCKMMDRQTFPNPAVVAEFENWMTVKVDVDQNRAVAQDFRTRSMPTLVLLNADGKEIARTEGYLGPSELVAFAARARGS